MKWICKDPLKREVILKEGTWEHKILRDHKEMEPYLNELKNLIENPYYIVKDILEIEPGQREAHPTREEYFDIIQSKTKSDYIVIRAVVDHRDKPGDIVTAWKTKKLNGLTTEGGIIYDRSEKTKNKKKC